MSTDKEKLKRSCEGNPCPLCKSVSTGQYFEDAHRCYLSCVGCGLVFVPERYWMSAEEERAAYDLHENDPGDAGYRQFLSRLSKPLLARLASKQKGLDFGCGPGPTLSRMLEAAGHEVDLYDPFYYNDASVFQKQYDFICATEVVEHLRHPAHTFAALFKMLKPGGWLALMTKLVMGADAFRQWHYIRDPTHLCFYGQRTLIHIAQRFDASLDIVAKDVILFNKR